MKTLYLHIGTPKTGTTSIQHFCYDNMRILAEKGYYYPHMPFEYPNLSMYRNGLFLEARCFKDNGERNIDMEQQNLNNGFKLVNKYFQTYDNIILSDEGVWSRCFNRKRLEEVSKNLTSAALEGEYAIKIIVYLRRQDEFLLSWYNQMIKHSASPKLNSLTWDEYFENYSKYISLDYLKCLNKLARVFGQENIIVKRFDSEYFYKNSLLADFLNIFGLELTEEFIVEKEQVNVKMSENACEIKRIINELEEIDVEEMRRYEKILLNISVFSERDYPSCRMSREERDEFMKQYEHSNQKLADKYIGDGRPLFNDIKSAKDKWQPDNPYLIKDMMRFMFMLDVCNSRDLNEKMRGFFKLRSNTLHNRLKTGVKSFLKKY